MASVPLNYYDLIDACALPGCPVCRLCESDARRYLDALLYEYVNEKETHLTVRASRGLCATHSAHMIEFGASVLGIAILHSSILYELLNIIDTPAKAPSAFARLRGGGSPLADRLEPTAACPVCEALERAERLHLRTLAEHLDDPRLLEALRASAGLCLPHLRDALRAAPNAATQEQLIALHEAIWRKLKSELETFALKYDINHADKAMGAEGDSWRRAAQLLAGLPAVRGLRRR
ncbi:MAG: hypothetical protein JNJ61_09070 [Anaerolineae bacterium]|nr:hypothetical protein [Anaerolineae bacterium]